MALAALTIALVAGAAGGVAGGAAVALLDGGGAQPPAASAPAAATTPAAPSPVVATPGAATPDGEAAAPLASAIRRALPAVVTVFADGPPGVDAEGRPSQQRSVGSGVVIDGAGHVLTAHHVVDGAVAIRVLLGSGEVRDAALVSHDAPYSDLAVLAIPPRGLRAIGLGDSDALRPGDPVAAVGGSVITRGNAVKVGVVSGIGRRWVRNSVVLEDLVQTDAATNHGDSGGALVNARGELVGLLTTVVRATPNGLAIEGVAFAQSSNSLRPIVEDIVALGVHPRPRLGIERPFRQHVELTPELAAERGLGVGLGALVVAAEPDGSAAAAGVLAGDVVVAVNGVAVDLERPFVNLLKALAPGETAVLTVVRGERRLVIPVTPRLE